MINSEDTGSRLPTVKGFKFNKGMKGASKSEA